MIKLEFKDPGKKGSKNWLLKRIDINHDKHNYSFIANKWMTINKYEKKIEINLENVSLFSFVYYF